MSAQRHTHKDTHTHTHTQYIYIYIYICMYTLYNGSVNIKPECSI